MKNLPRINIKTADDPGINGLIEPSTDFKPEIENTTTQELLLNSINKLEDNSFESLFNFVSSYKMKIQLFLH